MKFIAVLALTFAATQAFADSATFKLGKFDGEIVLEPADIKVERMELNARIQFCNFWGSSCAGGPQEGKLDKVAHRFNTSTNLLEFQANPISLTANKLGNRFSSCKLTLHLYGKNSKNENVEGYVGIIHENDKGICGSPSRINEQIAEAFKVPKKVKFFVTR